MFFFAVFGHLLQNYDWLNPMRLMNKMPCFPLMTFFKYKNVLCTPWLNPTPSSTLNVCNKWLPTTSPRPQPCPPSPHPPHPLPPSLPAKPRFYCSRVIGSGNLIYVSLEIEILTFALYSGDFTASSGTKLENFMGSE